MRGILSVQRGEQRDDAFSKIAELLLIATFVVGSIVLSFAAVVSMYGPSCSFEQQLRGLASGAVCDVH